MKMKKILAIIMAVFTIFAITACGGSDKPKGSSGTQASQTQPAKPKTLQQQGLEDKSVSTEYRNALKKAIRYATSQHMSKARVYKQLTSPYGEKFPQDAAQWAVSHLSDIDWKANALAKAKRYQENMSMSKERVRQQLSSPHGEEFTKEEADYAVSQLK